MPLCSRKWRNLQRTSKVSKIKYRNFSNSSTRPGTSFCTCSDRAQKNGALTEGTTLIHHKLANIVRSKGLALFETLPGDTFDADRHEAIAEIPAPTEELKGKIVDILEHGYNLGDRILRFAKVVVGK